MTFICYLTHSWPMFSFQIPWKHQKIGGLIRKRFPNNFSICRSSCLEVFLGKDVLKICSKFIGKHPCRNVISIKLQSSFIEITPWHGCSPVNLLHIFRTPFLKNTSGRLLLYIWNISKCKAVLKARIILLCS